MNFVKPMRAAVGQVWGGKSVRGQFNPGGGSFKSSVGSTGSQINDPSNQTAGVFGRAAGVSPANAPKGGLGFSPNSAAEYNSPAKAANGFGGSFARWGNAGKGVSGIGALGSGSAQRATQANNLRAARSVKHGSAGGFALEANLKPELAEIFMKRLHEFVSPLGEFNKGYAQEQESARATARLAKLNYRNAKREYKYIKQGVSDNPAIADLQQKLHDESYVRRGAGVGAGLGLLGGAAAGAGGFARGGTPGMLLGSAVGGLLGAYGGVQVGGRIRKNKEKAMSANLKPALRELAARSEKLKEFAMVRDANGQYVEVEDEGGMGMGTAVKAGAGAAAVGGAGYGAYRGHNAVMSKFGTFGPMEAGKSRMGEAYKGAGAAGLNAAKKSGFGTRLRGAFLGAARWMK